VNDGLLRRIHAGYQDLPEEGSPCWNPAELVWVLQTSRASWDSKRDCLGSIDTRSAPPAPNTSGLFSWACCRPHRISANPRELRQRGLGFKRVEQFDGVWQGVGCGVATVPCPRTGYGFIVTSRLYKLVGPPNLDPFHRTSQPETKNPSSRHPQPRL